MTFVSFHNQSLRQILAEVVEINRRNHATRRTPITSAAPTKVVPTVRSTPSTVAPPVTIPAVPSMPPTQTCRTFLSFHGCRFKDNCRFFHDRDALAKLKEQWASGNAKKKLEQVRANQQLAYNKGILAAKSNNATVSLATKVAVPVTVAAPSKPFPKAPTKKRQACKYFRSPRGCYRMNCSFSHEDVPPMRPQKLIDDTIPGEVQVLTGTKPISRNPRKPSKPFKAIVAKAVEPEETPVVHKPIIWADVPDLDDLNFRFDTVWKIFGKPMPTKKEAIEWCNEMHSNGNFKHFTPGQLRTWAKSINLQTLEEYYIYIGSLPGIFEQFNPVTQDLITKVKAAYNAEKARPKYDTFHCFGNLPAELCMKIWGFAVRNGRILTVTLNQKTIHYEGGPGLFIRHSAPSPLWYVCKQSQKASMMDRSCAYFFGCDYFSSRFDTLFLRDSVADIHRFAGQISDWRGKIVHRLSLPYYQVRNAICMTTMAKDLLEAFPRLIRIELLFLDTEYCNKKYLPNSASVLEKANIAIAKAYKGRRGMAAPRVRLVPVSEKNAKDMGITDGWW
ncbi:hypothetical protein NHQ30_000754 [Ciborinia camelliae]|nr:hypothetical protein NHQ30_000754 [Ciborinia camelliae]